MRIMSNGRIRRTDEEWREIFSRFETSKQSIEDFCSKERISPSSFRRRQDLIEGNASRDRADFVTVTPEAVEGWTLEVELPNGCRLRFQG